MRLKPLALLLALALPALAQQPRHHILFALSSGDQTDWTMVSSNMRNLIKGLPPNSAEVELVAFGPGITYLTKDSTAAKDIQTLETEQHVHFVACHNAMIAAHLTEADLAPGVTVVPSGLIEVVTRQEQGWSYIKAGR